MSDDLDEMNATEVRDLLKQWRENNERRSDDVVSVWIQNPSTHNKLGSDEYIILEQVFIAALDTHYYGLANFCLTQLSKEFPDSMRVMRLQASLLEAEEKYDEALAILSLQADETNAAARKRQVAILKALGRIPEAIKELVDYLKKFMSDAEAWQELCSLYLRCSEYTRAAFCAEELILQQPHNHLAHQRLADIYYTMGGIDNLELAKSYYCQALKLNPDNMRALLGLFLTTSNLLGLYKASSSSNSTKRKDISKLCSWAQSQSLKKQKEAQEDDSITQMMLTLVINE